MKKIHVIHARLSFFIEPPSPPSCRITCHGHLTTLNHLPRSANTHRLPVPTFSTYLQHTYQNDSGESADLLGSVFAPWNEFVSKSNEWNGFSACGSTPITGPIGSHLRRATSSLLDWKKMSSVRRSSVARLSSLKTQRHGGAGGTSSLSKAISLQSRIGLSTASLIPGHSTASATYRNTRGGFKVQPDLPYSLSWSYQFYGILHIPKQNSDTWARDGAAFGYGSIAQAAYRSYI